MPLETALCTTSDAGQRRKVVSIGSNLTFGCVVHCGDGGSSDESSFDCDYSDGGPVSESEEEGLEAALVHTAVPAVRRPYTNVICGSTRGSVALGRYNHARRPYDAGPGMLAVQIEERRRAELAFFCTTHYVASSNRV